MSGERVERRLAAILAADVAGYSRLMGADEEGTHERLRGPSPRADRSEDRRAPGPHRQDHRRRLAGGVPERRRRGACAVEVQRGMVERKPRCPRSGGSGSASASTSATSSSRDDDIFGDGVNVAARLEGSGRARRDLHLGHGARPYPRQAAYPSRIWASRASRTSRGRCGSMRCAREAVADLPASSAPPATSISQPARRAAPVDRRAALCQSQQRPRAAIFRGRDHRGSDDRSVADRGHAS